MAENVVNRVPTGIKTFDNLVEGGLPENSITLITGTPGTAKTIFGLQFICNGARDYNEKGVFITFEQSTESLSRQMSVFGYDMDALMKKGLIKVYELEYGKSAEIDPYSQLTRTEFMEDIKKFGAKRVVVDSISLVTNLSTSESDERKIVGEISGLFKYLETTTMFTHERKTSAMGNLEYSIEEFLVDGIVHLQLHMSENLLKRFLTVIKMRETRQSTGIYEFSLREDGVYVHD